MSKIQSYLDQKLPAQIKTSPERFSELGIKDKIVSLSIEGLGGGFWSLSFNGQGIPQLEAKLDPEAHCEIRSSVKTFEGILEGKVNVPFAFALRKIKVKGDLSLAAKVGSALRRFLLEAS